jgi:hypothetical protein
MGKRTTGDEVMDAKAKILYYAATYRSWSVYLEEARSLDFFRAWGFNYNSGQSVALDAKAVRELIDEGKLIRLSNGTYQVKKEGA